MSTAADSNYVHGRVKWFNDVSGYGFITPIGETDDRENDVFVHITDLKPKHNTIKPCLYTGEYVQYAVASNGQSRPGATREKAVEVTGAWGGPLLCDHGDIRFKHYSRIGFKKKGEVGASSDQSVTPVLNVTPAVVTEN